MKKAITLLCLLIWGISVFAQEFSAPKYKVIEKNVNDISSSFYYPKLMDKYTKGEEMNLEEQRHLYYGYVFQPSYSAIDTSAHNANMLDVLSKKSFSKADYANILSQADALLAQDPFNIRALNAKLLVFAQQDNANEYKKVANQRKNIYDAILSSGDGLEKKTAFYVTKVSHEYDLLGLFGYQYGGEEKIIDKHYNYLKIKDERFGIEKLYFEISPVLEYMRVNNRK